MQRIHKQYKDKGLMVIGLGFQDTRANLIQFAKDMHMDAENVVFDLDGKAAAQYGIVYGAGSVFIDKRGIVVKRFTGGFGEKEFLSATEKIAQ